jgi:hypothetical protein
VIESAGMTIEHKIVVGLGDIEVVIFECVQTKCRARVSVSPDKVQIPKQCPSCNESWGSGERRSYQSDTSQQTNFIDALSKLRLLEGNGAPFRILLEFEEQPKAGSPE